MERNRLDETTLARLPHRLPLPLGRRVGAHEAWRDAVDADPELAELASRLAREADQPRLRARVGLDPRQAVRAARARGDVHDAAAPARLHGRDGSSREVERAVEVDGEDRAPGLLGGREIRWTTSP